MILSEVVRASVADCCETGLSREMRVGKANQVDYFSGRSPLIGNIRVELERRREDPVNNVVKAWRQAAENPSEPPFILVHVFSGFYLSRKAKFENARFVGQMMNSWADASGRGITYLAVLIDFEPPMGDADPVVVEAVAQTIRGQIRRQLEGRIQKVTVTTGT